MDILDELAGSWRPAMIASDLDGTLLDDQERVTPALRRVLSVAWNEGVHVVLATGRPPRWVTPVVDQLDFDPVCVCANGALTIDTATGDIITTHELSPRAVCQIVTSVIDALGRDTVGFAVERSGNPHVSDGERFVFCPNYSYSWSAQDTSQVGLDELVSRPAVKLLIRADLMTSRELHDRLAGVIDPAVGHVSYSVDDGLVEVAAAGVTKKTGLADAARRWSIEPADVVAFGDMPNDKEMLSWAGLGVAMGNASPELVRFANYRTASNADDGVARVLERLFGRR